MATGELVFNTAMSGYQEVITDPSYAGQVIAFTSTHIGNYGTNAGDDEAPVPRCRGIVVRDLAAEPSNWRSTEALEPFLRRHGIPALTGVDTRRLTRHLRDAGAVPCAFGTAPEAELRAAAASAVGTDGRDLVSGVTTDRPRSHPATGTGAASGLRIVAYDFGVKATMVQLLTTLGTVTVVPAATSADEVLALEPDGVFLSNGPGDPAALPGPIAAVADLVGRVPVFGICLGHQILALALGGATYKLPFGHHGANHPVQRLETGVVEITSQNHNYAVAAGSVPDAETTHRQPERRRDRGLPLAPGAGLLGAVPPRGRSGAPRRPLPLRRLPRPHARPSDPARRRRGALSGGRTMPRRDDLRSILVIGSGPIVIGQACEFDYSGTQACRVLVEEGYRVILANSNPATIMTDPATADRTYVEPLEPDVLAAIIEKERPDALLPTLGGQTALNLTMQPGRARACSSATASRSSAPGPRRSRRPRTGTASRRRCRTSASRCPARASPPRCTRRRRSPRTSASRSWCARASSSAGRGRASPRTRSGSRSWPPTGWPPVPSARSWWSSRSPGGRSSSSR